MVIGMGAKRSKRMQNGNQISQTAIADLSTLLTIPRAVDHVTHETALQIKESANQLLSGAQIVADRMHELADAVSEHGRIAAEEVSRFCEDAKHTLEVMAVLQDRLNGKELPDRTSEVVQPKNTNQYEQN
jgi:polyhydroxyalkanoate synthesis regulator phasin